MSDILSGDEMKSSTKDSLDNIIEATSRKKAHVSRESITEILNWTKEIIPSCKN